MQIEQKMRKKWEKSRTTDFFCSEGWRGAKKNLILWRSCECCDPWNAWSLRLCLLLRPSVLLWRECCIGPTAHFSVPSLHLCLLQHCGLLYRNCHWGTYDCHTASFRQSACSILFKSLCALLWEKKNPTPVWMLFVFGASKSFLHCMCYLCVCFKGNDVFLHCIMHRENTYLQNVLRRKLFGCILGL